MKVGYKTIAYIICSLILSFYSFAIGQWKIFPHGVIKEVANSIQNQSTNIEGEKTRFGEIVNLNALEINQVNRLNNFNFKWGQLNVQGVGKVGAVELRGERVWYVNQNSPSLIEYLSLENTDYVEVKAIFSLKKNLYAYAAYIDGECASARIVSLTDKHIALQLSCLPSNEADMNGAGGGWLQLSDSEILLATGTPTSSSVENKINKTAQLDESLWGKILKIKIDKNKFSTEVFSKGHRNPQGIVKIKNNILAAEHGPMGGDEINLISGGGNYGWPLQSLGSEYDSGVINKSYEKPILTKRPLFSFVPSIGISDASVCPTIYETYYSPNDCLVVASMRAGSIYFIVYDKDGILFTEKIEFGSRVRKLIIKEDLVIGITDYEGLIIGELVNLEN